MHNHLNCIKWNKNKFTRNQINDQKLKTTKKKRLNTNYLKFKSAETKKLLMQRLADRTEYKWSSLDRQRERNLRSVVVGDSISYSMWNTRALKAYTQLNCVQFTRHSLRRPVSVSQSTEIFHLITEKKREKCDHSACDRKRKSRNINTFYLCSVCMLEQRMPTNWIASAMRLYLNAHFACSFYLDINFIVWFIFVFIFFSRCVLFIEIRCVRHFAVWFSHWIRLHACVHSFNLWVKFWMFTQN